jgi:hypothetical protein
LIKIQSAGRLGNILFIWSFAVSDSKKYKRDVEIFFDKYHSIVGPEQKITGQLLNCDGIRFKVNNSLGLLLKIVDLVENRSILAHKILCRLFGVRGEDGSSVKYTRILRGYFQTTEHILENVEYIQGCLANATHEISSKSKVIQNLKNRFPNYQVLHVRLGDFIGSEFGVINPISYSELITPNLPLVVCTDGTERQVADILGIKPDLILTPNETTAWETLSIIGSADKFVGVNSTLSWWGAFLVGQNEKEAHLPLTWNKSKSKQSDKLSHFPGINYYTNTFF